MSRCFNRKQRLALAVIAGFKCERCGEPLDSFEADHVMPFSKGGETHVRNGQALCRACNRSKGVSCAYSSEMATPCA
jgi:5-methylcytosine-specific restriction endonuclease McrA